MSEKQIEDELDLIFNELQYKGDEYPFEREVGVKTGARPT